MICGSLALLPGCDLHCPDDKPSRGTKTPQDTKTPPGTPTPAAPKYTEVFHDQTGAIQGDGYLTYGLVDNLAGQFFLSFYYRVGTDNDYQQIVKRCVTRSRVAPSSTVSHTRSSPLALRSLIDFSSLPRQQHQAEHQVHLLVVLDLPHRSGGYQPWWSDSVGWFHELHYRQ